MILDCNPTPISLTNLTLLGLFVDATVASPVASLGLFADVPVVRASPPSTVPPLSAAGTLSTSAGTLSTFCLADSMLLLFFWEVVIFVNPDPLTNANHNTTQLNPTYPNTTQPNHNATLILTKPNPDPNDSRL